jgi:WD40 repeat protein/Flp pilus assembly protein TadD
VAFSPDGTRIVTGSADRTAKVWDARTGAPLLDLQGHTSWVRCVSFSPDGTRIVTSSEDGTAKVWDARTGAPLLELKGHTAPVTSVTFSPDGTRIVSASNDQTLKVWDAPTGAPLLELKGHKTTYVGSVAFSPDGKRIVAVGGDLTAKVWDAPTETPLLDLKGHTALVTSVTFSPDGTRVVTGSWDQTAKVWDARTGTPLPDLKGHTGPVLSVEFSPDGSRIVTGGGNYHNPGEVKVWDARTGMPLLDLKGHTDLVKSVSFSPDGTRIVTGGGDSGGQATVKQGEAGEVTVWDARTGTRQLDLKGHKMPVVRVWFSPDGTRIATHGRDPFGPRETRVWDARTGTELKGEPIPPEPRSDRISPDGRWFSRIDDTRVELISLQPDEEELAYRRLHTQPDLWRYRAGYEAARKSNDDFAARFYLKLLPPPEEKILEAEAAAEREIKAGRTENALAHLLKVSTGKPEDTTLALKLATLQAWFGRDNEYADTCGRALEFAKGTFVCQKWDETARICSLRPTGDRARLEAAPVLARKALEIKGNFAYQLTLGMAEYRGGRFAEADAALIAAADAGKGIPYVIGTSAFYHAMSLFRQGRPDKARKLATEAAAKMKPLPKDEKNPLAGDVTADDLILWLAYKEAKELIKFDAAPTPAPADAK